MFVPARPPAPPTELVRRGQAHLLAALPELDDGTDPTGTDPYERTALSGDAGSSRPGTLDPTVADDERYVFGEVFAAGGLGVVRRGEDRRLGRTIAIKELLRDSPRAQQRFALEAAITARLQHPGIVPLYDLGWQGSGKPYYCMKLVEGESLEARIQRAQGLGARLRLIEHVVDVADAIAYAHERRIIHRDLKPANILVGRFGETVVIDWGLAKDLSGEIAAEVLDHAGVAATEGGVSDMTEAGTVMGTLRYMPPEQAAGEAVDARSDVYALGAILHHVLAGRPPFAEVTGQALLVHVLEGRRTDLHASDPAIPRELAAIAERAMARDPADRYPSAAAFAEDLRRFQAGRLVSAHSYSLAEVVRLWLRRHRAVVAVASVLLAALVVTGIVAGRRIDRERVLTAQAEQDAAAERERAERAAFERATLAEAERAGEVLRVARTPGRELDALALGVKVLARHEANHAAAPRVAVDGVAHALSAMLPVATLSSAERPVYSVRFSPDGAWLATTPRHTTAPGGRELAIWSTERLAVERTLPDRLPAEENSTGSMMFSPDGRSLAVSSTRRCIVWDVAGSGPERELLGCADLLFSIDGATLFGKVPAAEDEFGHTPSIALAAWDAGDGAARWSTPIAGKNFLVLVHPDGERLIVKTHEPSGEALEILAADSGRRLARLSAPEPIRRGEGLETAWMFPGDLALSPDGRQVADGRLNVWDLESRTARSLGVGARDVARAVAFSADGRRLLAHGNGLDVFALASGARTLSLPGEWFVAPLAFSEVGTDGKEFWGLSGGMWHQALSVGKIRQLESSADGRFVALVTDSEAMLWSTEDFAAVERWRGPAAESIVAHDEHEVVTRDAAGALRIHDRGGAPPVLLDGRGGDNPSRLGVAWSVGDGVWRQIVNDLDPQGFSVSTNNLRYHDRRSGRELFAHDDFDDRGLFLKRAQPSRRTSLVAIASEDGSVAVVDAARSRRICALAGAGSRVRAVATSEGGEWVAALRESGELAIWSTASCAQGAALRPFSHGGGGGIDELTTFEFAASGDLTLRSGAHTVVVDPRGGAVRLRVEDSCRRIGPGYSSLSPDGRYLLTACGLPDSPHLRGDAHGQAWLWAVGSGELVRALDLSGRSAHRVEFSRAGDAFALLTDQGALSLFATADGEETLQIRGRARLLKFKLRDDGAFADALGEDGAVYTLPITRQGLVAAACRALAQSALGRDVAGECGGVGR